MVKKHTTAKIRQVLADALDRATAGELNKDDARQIVSLANAISSNMAVECKVQEMKFRTGQKPGRFGSLAIG